MRLSKSEYETLRQKRPQMFPDLVCPMEADQPKPALPKALGGSKPKRKVGKAGVAFCISIIALTRRELDDDNLSGSQKPLRDGIAESLGIDDGDKNIRWEYSQARTTGQEGVLVKIEIG